MTNLEIEKKYFCSEHFNEGTLETAKSVQKKYKDKWSGETVYYLIDKCPICSKCLSFSSQPRKWENVPVDEDIPDEFLDYLDYIVNWT